VPTRGQSRVQRDGRWTLTDALERGWGRHSGDRSTVHSALAQKSHLANQLTHLAPQLLAKRAVGPVSAAQAIVSWSRPGPLPRRCRIRRARGRQPDPRQQRRIVRHRLNRGGDRHLNRALTTSS
jgi:transposase